MAGKAQVLGTLRNSRSQRASSWIMSLTTLVTFVEVFSINVDSVIDSKYFLENAKRGTSDCNDTCR